MVADRPHRSIGEVLALLQDDFPDVTISKIRFLESQGLIDPERTPSGYRRFYDDDIDTIRWILEQQRDHFLPLKVIKDRLDQAGGHVPADDTSTSAAGDRTQPATDDVVRLGGVAPAAEPTSAPAPAAVQQGPGPGAPAARPATAAVHRGTTAGGSRFAPVSSSVSLTADELATAAGLPAEQVAELERFGLLHGQAIGDTTVFDDDDLLVARLAAAFMTHGLEARHLRMYKVAAEREAGLFEQVVAPLVRQRSAGRSVARARLEELAALGDGMRTAMLRQALGDLLR